jgi:hypothetical protein
MKNPDFCLGFFFCLFCRLCTNRADQIGFAYFSHVKLRSIFLTMLLLSISTDAQIASAACSPKSSSAFASDSSISNNQVLVCATATQQKTSASTSTAKTTVKSTVKPLPPEPKCLVSASTTAQIVAAALAGCKIAGPSSPPAVLPKPVATVKVAEKIVAKTTTANSLSAQSDQAIFSPQPLAIQASTAVAQIGEALLLTSDAQDHESTAVILGRTGYVRFVPLAYSWSIATAGDSPVAVASFAASGFKSISLQVTYKASSRFSLSEPWLPVGQVFATAETRLEIVEPAKQPSPSATARARLKPHLVFASCETKPSTYRC